MSNILPIGQIILSLLLLVIGLMLAVTVVGMIVGLFTYKRPLKKQGNDSPLNDALSVGEGLTHLIIDKLKGGSRSKLWLDDQQLLARLRGMKPSEFEAYIAKMFTALGYRTMHVGGSGDGGIDIEMTKEGREYVVQCKKFITRKVEPHDVRDFFGAMGARHTNGKGFLITTNIFTDEAERFAENNAIEWIDHAKIVEYVRRSGIYPNLGTTSSPMPVTEPCPLCGKSLVVRVNRKNSNQFVGCSGYPSCRYTKAM